MFGLWVAGRMHFRVDVIRNDQMSNRQMSALIMSIYAMYIVYFYVFECWKGVFGVNSMIIIFNCFLEVIKRTDKDFEM